MRTHAAEMKEKDSSLAKRLKRAEKAERLVLTLTPTVTLLLTLILNLTLTLSLAPNPQPLTLASGAGGKLPPELATLDVDCVALVQKVGVRVRAILGLEHERDTVSP